MATRHIIVVDDDETARAWHATMLRAAGFEVSEAANGVEAIALAHARPTCLIVLDMVMPEMDGWAFCAHRRYDPILALIPVVVISAVTPSRLHAVPAVAALQKPVEADELLALVLDHCLPE